MSDLNDRQAAIEALNGTIEITGKANAEAVKGYGRLVKDRIERLPSAQPDIIRCRDCKHRYTDECLMRHVERVSYDDDGYVEYDDVVEDYTCDDGFCHKNERRTDESIHSK